MGSIYEKLKIVLFYTIIQINIVYAVILIIMLSKKHFKVNIFTVQPLNKSNLTSYLIHLFALNGFSILPKFYIFNYCSRW